MHRALLLQRVPPCRQENPLREAHDTHQPWVRTCRTYSLLSFQSRLEGYPALQLDTRSKCGVFFSQLLAVDLSTTIAGTALSGLKACGTTRPTIVSVILLSIPLTTIVGVVLLQEEWVIL